MNSLYDLESSLIGMALMKNDILSLPVSPDDFKDDLFAKAWRKAREMVSQGLPADAVTVGSELGGDAIYTLGTIQSEVVSTASGEYAARVVKEKGLERRTAEIATMFAEGQIDKPQLLSQLRALEMERELPAATAYSTMSELIEFLDNPPEAIETGIDRLDESFSGLHRGDLNIIQARPGIGKTAMAITLCLNMAKEKNSGLFVTCEMPAHQILGRLVSQHTGIPSYKMRSGKLTDDEWSQVANAGADLKDLPIHMMDPSIPRITDIIATSEKVKERDGLDVVFIDYAQRLKLGRRAESFRMEQVEMAKLTKAMARDLDVAVVLLAQSHRRVDEYPIQVYGQMPRQGDIGESSQYEQEADMIISVARQGAIAMLDVCKNRHGPVGMVPLDFHEKTMRFQSHKDVALKVAGR